MIQGVDNKTKPEERQWNCGEAQGVKPFLFPLFRPLVMNDKRTLNSM